LHSAECLEAKQKCAQKKPHASPQRSPGAKAASYSLLVFNQAFTIYPLRFFGGFDGVYQAGRSKQFIARYLVRALQNRADAEALLQETFVRVYQNRSKFDARRKFSTWLYAIASNSARVLASN
jgi:hypothetical protein